MSPSDCVFCRIVQHQKEAQIIYEDEEFMAFLDQYPKTWGHSLVIPKAHVEWVDEVENFGDYFEAAKKVALALKKVLKPKFIAYLTYGLEIPHAHIHVMPRYQTSFLPTREELQRGGLDEQLVAKIKREL